jgi:hypothetical protein
VPVFGLLPWIVPALGLGVGLLAARSASVRHDARWATLFITRAALVVALLVLSFAVAVALALFVLPFGKPGSVSEANEENVLDHTLTDQMLNHVTCSPRLKPGASRFSAATYVTAPRRL